MGTADREYTRGRMPGAMQRLTPVVKWLLIANLAIFFIDYLLLRNEILRFGAFAIQSAIFEFRIWEFVMFQFLHGSLGHVAFNCIGLFFFGPFMERHWGSRRFLIFYLLCGVAGAAFYTLLFFSGILPGTTAYSGLVGASAGIYGILAGVAVIAPNMRVALLFPPVEMTMRTLAIIILCIAAGSIILRMGGNEGGEAGHLGGAIMGFLLIRFPHLLGWGRFRRGEMEVIRPKAFSRRSESKIRPRSEIDLSTQSEVDRILDKISRDGFQSLTQAERDVLQRAAESHRPDK
jgi:membrane associated rhomboid family serine protease